MIKKTDSANSILFFEMIVAEYRIDIYEMLYQKFGVVVCHSKEKNNSSLKDCYSKMNYKNHYLKRLYIGRFCIQNIFGVLFRTRPKIIICDFAVYYMSMWLLLLLKPIMRYKLIIYTHGVKNSILYNYQNKIWYKLSKYIYNYADAVLVYTKGRAAIIEKYTAKEKIFVTNNTLNTKSLYEIYSRLNGKGKQTVKDEIGFSKKFNIIYTGRLIGEKRLDVLLDSVKNIGSAEIALHIIGDGPLRNLIVSESEKNENIFYYGSIYDNEILGKYLYASDIAINLGTVGLNIVHAFSFGLPFITADSTPNGPFHGPEFEYLQDSYNGYKIKNESELIDKLNSLIENPLQLKTLSENALNTAYINCKVENMCKGFEDAINYVSER